MQAGPPHCIAIPVLFLYHPSIMRAFAHLFLSIPACLGITASAQTEGTSLERNSAVFEEKWTGIQAAWSGKVKERREKYLAEVAALEKSCQAEGDLDGVLACRAEVARVDAGGGPPGVSEEMSAPELLPMETLKTGDALPEGGRRLKGEGEGKSLSFPYFFSAGHHRFVLTAAQQKAGKEDVKGVFKVGDVFQSPFVVSLPKASPGPVVFECDLPGGGHPITVELANPGTSEGVERALLVRSLTVESPVMRSGFSKVAGLAARQEAWAGDYGEFTQIRNQDQKDLARKYLDALGGQKTNLVRGGREAEAGLVQAEIDRVRQMVPGLATPSPAPVEVAPAGPSRVMVQYSFDAPTGRTIKPDGGQGPELEIHGGASFMPVPNSGCVLNLAGNKDYLSATSAAGLDLDGQSFTIIYLAQEMDAVYSAILYKGREGVEESELVVGNHGGKLVFKMGLEKLTYEPKADLEIWKQVALVFNAATREQKIYIDGREVASRAAATMLKGSDGQPLLVGRHPHRQEVGFNGKLDNLRIANRAFAAHEISTLYQRDKVELDRMIRSWLGPPPRNPRELETYLASSWWVIRLERAPEGVGLFRYAVFRPGGRFEILGGYEHYLYKATSARNIEVWRENSWSEQRGTVYKLEFAAGADRFTGEYMGEGSRDYGTKRRGVFIGREKR